MGLCQYIRQYSAHGKRPADTCFSGRTRDEWFKCNECLAFGSLQDGSYLGIGKDDTNVLTMVRFLLTEEAQKLIIGKHEVDLTRFNKIDTQGAPQMAVDKEANSLSRVYSYYSKFNLRLFYV